MRDYSDITKVITSENVQEVNQLLESDWILISVCKKYNGKPLFVLGLPYQFDEDAYCAGAV